MDAQQIEMLIFRYIDKVNTEAFISQMKKWKIPLIDPVASAGLWSYPNYAENLSIYPSQLTDQAGSSKHNLQLSLTELKSMKIVSISPPPPSHYPFQYVVIFHFTVKPPYRLTDRQSLLDQLIQATDEVKLFTDAVCLKAQYRPVFWFLSGIPTELRGLKGVLNEVKSTSGEKIEVERGFPDASYIIYDTSPQQEERRVTDLGLLSVVAHITERRIRNDLTNLTNEIRANLQVPNKSQTQAAFRQSIEKLSDQKKALHDKMSQYYALCRDLVRIKGLVLRIREKCGGLDHKNLFDLVCDDAMTVIGEESEVSQAEIETSIKEQSDWLNNTYNQLNDTRSSNLQRIGNLLQSTAIAFIAFQIADKLFEILGITNLTRLFFDVVITILLGVVAFLVLSRLE